MADKTIGQLPNLGVISDASMLPVEEAGTAYHTTGEVWKNYVGDAAQAAIAGDLADAQASAEQAYSYKVDAEIASSNAAAAADSASNSANSAVAAKTAIDNLQVTSSTLAAGSDATVTKSTSGGVTTFVFGIPRGDTGAQGSQGPRGPQGVQGPKGDTGTAVAVETTGMYYFHVDNNSASPTYGHLFLTYTGEDEPNFSINENGHLIWTVS